MYEAEAIKPILALLEQVRQELDAAYARLKSYDELRALRWRCTECGYIKHFIHPMPAGDAPPCPKCSGEKLVAML